MGHILSQLVTSHPAAGGIYFYPLKKYLQTARDTYRLSCGEARHEWQKNKAKVRQTNAEDKPLIIETETVPKLSCDIM